LPAKRFPDWLRLRNPAVNSRCRDANPETENNETNATGKPYPSSIVIAS
jgi:hypothetical protein